MTEPRRTWPTPMSTAGVGEGHTHELPEDLVERVRCLDQRVRRATVINVINLLIVGAMMVFMGLFILDRGQDRDARERQMRREIADSWCEALDAFPRDNFFLDQLRDKYDCGPGRPVEELPEDVQRDLNGQATPAPPPTPEGVETLPDDFALPGGAVQQEPREPYFPTPGMAEPEPTIPPPPGFPPPDPVQPTGTPPLVNLEPITDSVCEALAICV